MVFAAGLLAVAGLVELGRPEEALERAGAVSAAAAARLIAGTPGEARGLLAEIERTPGVRDNPYYSRQLSTMLRTALAAGTEVTRQTPLTSRGRFDRE